jgi:hypothetical protein
MAAQIAICSKAVTFLFCGRGCQRMSRAVLFSIVVSVGFIHLPSCGDDAMTGGVHHIGRVVKDVGSDVVEPPVGELCGDRVWDPTTIPVNQACLPAAVGSFKPVLEWTSTTPGDSHTTPIVGNLTDDNGDGKIDTEDIPDIVVGNRDGRFSVMSGDGSGLHWSYKLTTTAVEDSLLPATPAIGDVDGDGFPEVVVAGVNGVAAVNHDGSLLWLAAHQFWGESIRCGGVGLYDLDRDGVVEIVIGNVILDGPTGNVRGVGKYGRGSGHPEGLGVIGVAADLIGNPDLEVVVGNALYDVDGNALLTLDKPDGFVAIADFNADGKPEVVVAENGNVRLQRVDGSIVWAGSYTGNRIGPPTVADFDGDGEPEIGVAGNGQYLVIEGDGAKRWIRPTQDLSSGFTGSSVFDFEGDGAAEVVYADETRLWVFDGATGAIKLEETHHSSATCSEYPVIADVDKDGQAEIVYAHSLPAVGGGGLIGVSVVGDSKQSWQKGSPVWNQHGYSITNVSTALEIPKVTSPNWLNYNSFRSGDLTANTGGAAADAVLELVAVCTDDCADGTVRVVIRVGNSGVVELPKGVAVSAYRWSAQSHQLLETVLTDGAIQSGNTTVGITFSVPADLWLDGQLLIRADDDNGTELLAECNETNNAVVVSQSPCL